SEYTDGEDCNDDTSFVGEVSVELIEGVGYCGSQFSPGDTCWDINSCGCEWDSGDLICGTKKIVDTACISPSDTIIITRANGKCVMTQDIWDDQCDTTGIIIASWTGIGTIDFKNTPPLGPRADECPLTLDREIACPDITKLSFFSWFNIIVIILILFIGYYYYLKTHNSKKGKVKKKIKKKLLTRIVVIESHDGHKIEISDDAKKNMVFDYIKEKIN
ncbi:MAG: hypothetical protein IID03_06595, partial [Candidatus Dadabacteria bacterium]|nr:hypothetical protein [Candidatus Dadabacteria bacterium]